MICNSGCTHALRRPALACALGAMLAPVKAPPQIVARLNREFVRSLGMPEMREKLMSEGGEVTPTTPKEAVAFVHSEVAKWGEVIRKANITAD